MSGNIQMFFMAKAPGGGGGGATAQLPASISASDYQYFPDPGYAQVVFNSNGTWSSSPGGSSGTWLLTGSASDCEIQFDLTGGITPGGAAVDTWLSLSTTRTWSLSIPASSADSKFSNGTMYIREAGGSTLASCPVSISVLVE